MGNKLHRPSQTGPHFDLSALPAVCRHTRVAAFAQATINLIFPQRCFVCGELIDAAGALCADCWGELSFMGPPCCVCCGYPFEFAVRDGALCAARMKRPPPYTSARSALLYDDASRPLVLAFKHADRTRYANAFGHWLARVGAELCHRRTCWCLSLYILGGCCTADTINRCCWCGGCRASPGVQLHPTC